MVANSELYDPASGTWSLTASLNVGRTAHTATLLPDGKVLIAGGVDDDLFAIQTTEVYEAAALTWSASGRMNLPRPAREAVLLANDEVLVAGGYNGNVLTNAERYDPSNGMWTPTGSLFVGRLSHTLTLLPMEMPWLRVGLMVRKSRSPKFTTPSTGHGQ
jgi:N-acetylneuraminic acid mutarotase